MVQRQIFPPDDANLKISLGGVNWVWPDKNVDHSRYNTHCNLKKDNPFPNTYCLRKKHRES